MHMCDMTHSYVHHEMCTPRKSHHIELCAPIAMGTCEFDMTHSCVRHDSIT